MVLLHEHSKSHRTGPEKRQGVLPTCALPSCHLTANTRRPGFQARLKARSGKQARARAVRRGDKIDPEDRV